MSLPYNENKDYDVAGKYAIFVDEPYTNAAYEQAADRIYRIGQNQKVTIIKVMKIMKIAI